VILLEGVIRRGSALGFHEVADRGRVNLSVLAADDDVRYARDIAMDGLRDAAGRGARSDAAFHASNAAEFDMHLGNLEPAYERVTQVLGLDLEGGDLSMNLFMRYIISTVAGKPTGDVDAIAGSATGMNASVPDDVDTWRALVAGDGRAAIRHGLEFARDDELNASLAYLRAAVGAAMVGDASAARTAADESRAGMRWGRVAEAIQAGTEAIALALEGSRERADEAARASLEGLRAGGIRLIEGLVLYGLGLALLPQQPGPAYVAQARRLFDEIGAAGLVASVDRLAAGSSGAPAQEAGATDGAAEAAAAEAMSS
jgi:hypothetical protein